MQNGVKFRMSGSGGFSTDSSSQKRSNSKVVITDFFNRDMKPG